MEGKSGVLGERRRVKNERGLKREGCRGLSGVDLHGGEIGRGEGRENVKIADGPAAI